MLGVCDIKKVSVLKHSIRCYPKQQILDFSKLKEFVDDNSNENGMFSKRVENIVGNFSFSHSGFKGLVLQSSKNMGLFGKGLCVLYQNSISTEIFYLYIHPCIFFFFQYLSGH